MPLAKAFAKVLILCVIALSIADIISLSNSRTLVSGISSQAMDANSDSLFDTIESIGSASFSFPSDSNSTIDGSRILADDISNRLGIDMSDATHVIWLENPCDLDLLDRDELSLDPNPYVLELYSHRDQWYNAITYLTTSMNLTLFYDDLHDDEEQVFRALRIEYLEPGLVFSNFSEQLTRMDSILENLGISTSYLNARIFNYSNIAYFLNEVSGSMESQLRTNLTDIIMSMQYAETNLSGCNCLGFRFDADSHTLMEIQISAFLDLPDQLQLSSADAVNLAESLFLDYARNSMTDILEYDEIAGIHLFPRLINASQIDADSTIMDGSRVLSFAFIWIGHLCGGADSSAIYQLFLLIDADTGEVVYSIQGSIGWQESDAYINLKFMDMLIQWAPLIVIGFLSVFILLAPIDISLPIISYGVFVIAGIRGPALLDHFRRGQVYEYIRRKPGCSFSDMKEDLKIMNGNLAYHLAILEKGGLVRSQKDGRIRRHYADDFEPGMIFDTFFSRTQGQILHYLKVNGPTPLSNISASLGMSRQRVHYNLKRLARGGVVESQNHQWYIRNLDCDIASDS